MIILKMTKWLGLLRSSTAANHTGKAKFLAVIGPSREGSDATLIPVIALLNEAIRLLNKAPGSSPHDDTIFEALLNHHLRHNEGLKRRETEKKRDKKDQERFVRFYR